MRKDEKALLIGMAIGDGYIRLQQSGRGCLQITQCEAQEEYVEHKRDLIHSIIGGRKPKITRSKYTEFTYFRFTKTHRYFRVIHRWLYPGGKKKLTRKLLDKLNAQAIAIWYMDDGSLKALKQNGKIHAFNIRIATCFKEKEEAQMVIDYFYEVWDIKFRHMKDKDYHSIRCGTREARKFIKIVEPYMIPCMKYKITMNRDLNKSAEHAKA